MTKDEALKLALEALEATLGTLIAANEKGIITDTIWFSKYETLFDYISSEIAVFNEALAQHDSVQAKPEPEQKDEKGRPLTDELYNELLFAVGNKYPNETRHQTALRYIQQAEMKSNQPAKAAHGIFGDAK